MIPPPSGVRVWLATGSTVMRRGMNGLALQVEQALGRDPHAGDLFVFRGRRRGGDLGGAVGLHAGGDRLAEPASHLAANECWLNPTMGDKKLRRTDNF